MERQGPVERVVLESSGDYYWPLASHLHLLAAGQSFGAAGVAFKPPIPAPLVDFAVAFGSDDPNPLVKHLLSVVDEIIASTNGWADADSELLSGL